jgi:hypothetical protein
MAGAEVSYERVGVFERQTLLNMLATAVNESARNQAANEAIIGRVREVEQEMADADRVRQQLQETAVATQRDYEACIRERDALTEKLGAAKDQYGKSYSILQDAHRSEVEEGSRLRQLVRDLGGDPTQPGDDDGGPDVEARVESDDEAEDPDAGDDDTGTGVPGPVRGG